MKNSGAMQLADSGRPTLSPHADRPEADIGETMTDRSASDLIELAVIVPTFNEAKNVPILVERLHNVLAATRWEVTFVDDDSPDATAAVARDIARHDRCVRVIRRVHRRGLSSACVEGVLASAAPAFAVMDGDLQHDEKLLQQMLRVLTDEQVDIVVGSRYKDGERTEGLNPWRKWVSRTGGRIARLVLKADLTDPMSGFFVMSRAAFDACMPALSQQGFKILLDIFASSPRPLRYVEVPCGFNPRQHGESKLDTMAAWEFGVLIIDKLLGRYLPTRFVIFAAVGATGIVAHLATLGVMGAAGFGFQPAQATAVFAAMTWNFVLDNTITYRDQRLRGAAFWRGLASFYAIGAIGGLGNIGITEMLFGQGDGWWLAGTAGALIGVVWNFTMSSLFTWRGRSV
jgi:dolichol-phosphate mannosyltransferase